MTAASSEGRGQQHESHPHSPLHGSGLGALGLDYSSPEGQPGGRILNCRGKDVGLGELLVRNLETFSATGEKKKASFKPDDPDLGLQLWLTFSQASNS